MKGVLEICPEGQFLPKTIHQMHKRLMYKWLMSDIFRSLGFCNYGAYNQQNRHCLTCHLRHLFFTVMVLFGVSVVFTMVPYDWTTKHWTLLLDHIGNVILVYYIYVAHHLGTDE